jgi:hypothetical protein
MTPTKRKQVIAYIHGTLKKRMEKEIAASLTRRSMSAHIESIIKQHYDKQLTA